MSRFDDRLLAMERLLQELSQQRHDSERSNSITGQESNRQERTPPSIHLPTALENYGGEEPLRTSMARSSMDSTRTMEAAFHRDTVDGMGAITFADECASGPFGW